MHAHRIATCRNLQEYFQQAIRSALINQKIDTDEITAYYLVQLLIHFSRAENLFTDTEQPAVLKPLAQHLADAQFATDRRTRSNALRRLGDFALFFVGFFADYLNRRPVDVDYYVGMGGGAYATLHREGVSVSGATDLSEQFRELSDKFIAFADVIAEVGEDRDRFSSSDVLRIYEVWLRTGSRRAARRLRALGIEPNVQLSIRRPH